MEASSVQHQEMGTHVLDNMLVRPKPQQDQERKPRPQPDQALKCPRCDSTNTKFCYYNNYSLSQPRYFCKSCRRYWTKGGTLRNVPVGGGCRKNKRSSSSSSKIKTTQDHPQLGTTANCSTNPFTSLHNLPYDSNDLSLAFARLQKQEHDLSILGNQANPNPEFLANPCGFDALRTGFLDTQNPNFMYYGYGSGMGEVENSSGVFVGGEMVNVPPYNEEMSNSPSSGATTQAVTVTTMKQELCNESSGNKVLWGYPWQFNGNGNMGMSNDLDSTRESWINGIGGSTWHGLINSPLM